MKNEITMTDREAVRESIKHSCASLVASYHKINAANLDKAVRQEKLVADMKALLEKLTK
jgi:hypothetical protein